MKKYLLLAILLLPMLSFCQINVADSTVQVVGYWDRNEKQAYEITYSKARIKGNDTIVVESSRYMADIAVIDSSANSYTIEWKYRNVVMDKGNDVAKKLAALTEGMVLRFTTDEFGSFKELLNWQDIKKHNDDALKLLEKNAAPAMYQSILLAMRSKFSTREGIEAHSIKDIALFYGFHGIALQMDETLEETIEEPSPYTTSPIKSLATVELAEIDPENATYIIKFWQDFDGESVAGLVFDAFQEIKEYDTAANKLSKKDFSGLTIELTDYTGAMLHESGWPINIYYERTMDVEGQRNIETRTILIE